MDVSNVQFLQRLSNIVQIGAIVLGFLALSLQASRFYLDKKINDIKNEKDKQSKQTIDNLKSKVDSQALEIEGQQNRIQELVNKIVLESEKIEKTKSGYTVLLSFKASRNEPLGRTIFEVRIPYDSKAQIKDLWPTSYGSPFAYQNNSLSIYENGKRAQIKYDLWGNIPSIQVNVTEATKLQISGNHDLEKISINIDPHKEYPMGSDQRRVGSGSITF